MCTEARVTTGLQRCSSRVMFTLDQGMGFVPDPIPESIDCENGLNVRKGKKTENRREALFHKTMPCFTRFLNCDNFLEHVSSMAMNAL